MEDYTELTYMEKLILARRLLTDIAGEDMSLDFDDIETTLDLLIEEEEVMEEMKQ